jgi:protein SCO1/2
MTPSYSPRRRATLRAGAALALAGLLTGLTAGCQRKQLAFNSTDVTGSDIGGDLNLTDHNGVKREMADFRGKAVVVFFGFIQCPDVCPTTLANFAEVMKRLGPEADKVQVVFVTVDPERDTAAVMKEYVTQFDPRFLGLSGSAEDTARVAKSFKVFYAKVPGKEPGSYSMDHSAGIYIFDPKGNLRLYGRHTATPDALASDIRQLLD